MIILLCKGKGSKELIRKVFLVLMVRYMVKLTDCVKRDETLIKRKECI